ncbi:MAG: hypothetical protein BAA04_10275 [Firmicutes bacterium ZCTH02-B6]|nr:MAG: hypothetical protein BAA04_10275 [Firmicutes bacterium ZCTH02-B6]
MAQHDGQNQTKQRMKEAQRARRPAQDTEFAAEPGIYRHNQRQKQEAQGNRAFEADEQDQQ